MPDPTATPPRADLRTLATIAAHDVDCPEGPNCREDLTTDGRYGRYADAVLAAVLPEHRRMVLAEIADDLHRVATHLRATNPDSSVAKGVRYAEARIRAQLTAAPPAGPSVPVPAGNAPAVPEEADGQRATEGDALTYAEMEAERDRLAGELYEAQMMTVRLTVDDDARDGTRRAWLELEHWRTVIVPELIEQRDRLADTAWKLTADRDRLAAQVAHHQRVVEQVRAIADYVAGGPDWHSLIADRLRAAVDALPDACTQPCPTPSDAKSGMVPLADVLDALRDHDGFVDWTRTKGPRGYIDDYVVRQYREACADYLAERFAPTTAPEGADERNGHG